MVIFDMAGTTIDEDNLVYKCIRKAFEVHGLLTSLQEVLLHCAGKEKKEAIRGLLSVLVPNQVTDQQVQEMYLTFSQLMDEAYEIAPIRLMEGMRSVLFFLKKQGIRAVFNTGYNEDVAMKILTKVNCLPGQHFDYLITADMVQHSRPAPDMIFKALDQFAISGQHCIKIGDSIIDIEEGKNAGVRYSLGITTGAHEREQLLSAEPDEILDDITEIIPFIERINANSMA
jgi:phosphonatase-like hydrolase